MYILLKTFSTMTIMTTTAVVFLFVTRFFLTTFGIMILTRRRHFSTSRRIHIQITELFTTFPAPRSSATGSYHESTGCLQSTSKNIVTGSIFQAPSFTPGALFGIHSSVPLD